MRLGYQILLKSTPNPTGWIRLWHKSSLIKLFTQFRHIAHTCSLTPGDLALTMDFQICGSIATD